MDPLVRSPIEADNSNKNSETIALAKVVKNLTRLTRNFADCLFDSRKAFRVVEDDALRMHSTPQPGSECISVSMNDVDVDQVVIANVLLDPVPIVAPFQLDVEGR